jgi:hypothetical protein
MRRAQFEMVKQDKETVVLADLGPHDCYPTITNDAEYVVEAVAPILRGRRLLYYDSEGELTELLHKDGVFKGFA